MKNLETEIYLNVKRARIVIQYYGSIFVFKSKGYGEHAVHIYPNYKLVIYKFPDISGNSCVRYQHKLSSILLILLFQNAISLFNGSKNNLEPQIRAIGQHL